MRQFLRPFRSLPVLLALAFTGCDSSEQTSGNVQPAQSARLKTETGTQTRHIQPGGPAKSHNDSSTSTDFEIARRGLADVPTIAVGNIVGKDRSRDDHQYYRVIAGDTLSKIAKDNGCVLADLLKANGLTINATIHPGQLIYLPPLAR